VLELGDPAGLLTEEHPTLPSPASLLPPAGIEHPPVRIQLLFTGVPAPALRSGGGTPANSYRQLTGGRVLGHSRALLAVRVLHAEGFSEQDLRRALSGLVRKLPRRLPVPARPLGEAATARIFAELGHHDGSGFAHETWPGLRLGGLTHATFRVYAGTQARDAAGGHRDHDGRGPDLRTEMSRRLVSRLLALPASATTVAVIAGPQPAASGHDLTVRLAAPDAPSLHFAAESLGKLLAGERAHARRLDGEHREGLAATLPLGGGALGVPGRRHEDPRLEGLELPVAASGLMLGCNRRGEPVVARLFRPEQTRALLVGGVRCAQLIALRAMALGARVVVQTARPQVWSPFVRGVALPGKSIAVIPPGRVVELPPGSVLHPLLVIVDVGPVGADVRPGAGFQATLVVRDDFSPADVDVATRADLLILQPLTPDEATLAGAALGLGEAAQWLTRIRADMIGVVNRRAVRWALLTPTPIEAQLIGPPDRD